MVSQICVLCENGGNRMFSVRISKNYWPNILATVRRKYLACLSISEWIWFAYFYFNLLKSTLIFPFSPSPKVPKWRRNGDKKAVDTFFSITNIVFVLVLILVDYCVVLMVFSGQELISELYSPFLLFVYAWYCCKWHSCDGTNFGPLLLRQLRWLWSQIWPQIIFSVSILSCSNISVVCL